MQFVNGVYVVLRSVQLNVNLVSLKIDKFDITCVVRVHVRRSLSKIALPVTVQFGTPAGRGKLARGGLGGRAMCRGVFSVSSILGLIPGRHDSYHIGRFSSERMQKFQTTNLEGSGGGKQGTPVAIVEITQKFVVDATVSRSFGIT